MKKLEERLKEYIEYLDAVSDYYFFVEPNNDHSNEYYEGRIDMITEIQERLKIELDPTLDNSKIQRRNQEFKEDVINLIPFLQEKAKEEKDNFNNVEDKESPEAKNYKFMYDIFNSAILRLCSRFGINPPEGTFSLTE